MRLLHGAKSRKESIDHESECGLESMASEYKISYKGALKAAGENGFERKGGRT